MVFIHPLFQMIFIILFFYVFILGIKRFLSRHMQSRVHFPWDRHVALGKVVFTALLLGFAGGLLTARILWEKNFITGLHAYLALILIPFFLLGFISGVIIDRGRGRFKILAVIHGINNSILLLLIVLQAYLGIDMFFDSIFII